MLAQQRPEWLRRVHLTVLDHLARSLCHEFVGFAFAIAGVERSVGAMMWNGNLVRSAALCMSLTLFTPAAMAPRAQATPPPPSNVLFVLTDDMRFDDLQYLPQVRQIIGDQGLT